MRILWLSPTKGLLMNKFTNFDNSGGGWVSSLQSLVESEQNIDLGLCYLSEKQYVNEVYNGTHYFSIKSEKKSLFQKIKNYYGGYKKIEENKYVHKIKNVIEEFNPDIIHIFGFENPLATIIGKTDIPIIIHIQGLLGPINNAFYPVDFNKSSFYFPIKLREWILRNGYIYAKNSMEVRAKFEKNLFKKTKHLMGRTEWDYQVSNFLTNETKYYHVNEVMRKHFYDNMGKWNYLKKNKYYIVTTISDTIYKGLDLILKTAYLLKNHSNINFEWKVIGINKNDSIISFFEKKIKVSSEKINVKYLGSKNAEELCDIELKSDVYVHPSYIDNSPNSLCEAQLLGLPIIATNVGGVSSLVENNISGILVPANAPYELAYHLKALYYNKTLCEALSKNAKEKSNIRHNKTIILQELIKSYKDIIKHNSTNMQFK